VNVGLPVWTWGATRAGVTDARAGVQDATVSLESQRSAVALQVTQAYFGVLLAREGVDVAADALAQAQRQEAVAAERLAAGAASEFELLRARVQVANLRPGLARAEAALRQANIGLSLLLGLPPDEVVEITGQLSYEPVDLDLDALRAEALAERPEMRSARLARQRADLALKMARSTRLPTVAVSGSYMFRADDAAWGERFNDNYMANLVVSVPLFDGFSARSSIQRASAGGRQADILLEQTERSILAEVEQAYRDLHAAEQSYLAQVDNVAQAERALEIAQVSFENEIMTSVELMDSQLALTMARQNHSRSLYDYQVALARIRTAVGRPVVR
jgi:outer membrane protein TolC